MCGDWRCASTRDDAEDNTERGETGVCVCVCVCSRTQGCRHKNADNNNTQTKEGKEVLGFGSEGKRVVQEWELNPHLRMSSSSRRSTCFSLSRCSSLTDPAPHTQSPVDTPPIKRRSTKPQSRCNSRQCQSTDTAPRMLERLTVVLAVQGAHHRAVLLLVRQELLAPAHSRAQTDARELEFKNKARLVEVCCWLTVRKKG